MLLDADRKQALDAVAASPIAAAWPVLENIGRRFPALGDVQVVGRPGEAMPLRHRREGAQLAQLEARTSHHTRDLTPSRRGSDKPRLLSNNKLRLFLWAAQD